MKLYKSIDELPEMLKVQEAADYLRISKSKMYELTKAIGFPLIMPGNSKRIIIPKKQFVEWINAHLKKGA